LEVSETSKVLAKDLKALVADWSERIGVTVRRVQVRAMRRKWASCSSRGNLTLSTDLLRLPRDLVEYVVCHELVHLHVPEHGKGWQALMGAYLSDWRERERRLAAWTVDRQQEVH
jgi:predicted metal-dependent hydrolase